LGSKGSVRTLIVHVLTVRLTARACATKPLLLENGWPGQDGIARGFQPELKSESLPHVKCMTLGSAKNEAALQTIPLRD